MYNCVRLLPYAYGQHINVRKHVVHVVTMNQQAVLDDDQAVLELFDKYCEL